MPKRGEKLSLEARAKISAARRKPQAICTCLNCGIQFNTHQSEVRRGGGKFCCKKCEGEYRKGKLQSEETCIKKSIALKGRVFTPEWKAKISASLMGKPSCRKGKKHTEDAIKKMSERHVGLVHSEEVKEKMSEQRKGQNNPAWNGGVSFGPYCPKFNREFKERVRAFFGYKCMECGAPQNGEKLTVHHVLYNKQTCCDGSIPMFAPLCRSCHAKTNHNRKFWEAHFALIIREKYRGKSFFTKEEMAEHKKI